MIETLRRWLRRPLDDRLVPLLLLVLAFLAYGLLFLWQGYYWDDYPLTWTAHTFGLAGLARYFSTNRPYWGLLYQLSNSLLSAQPWQWQLFALFWRWAASVTFWLALRRLWPGRRSTTTLAAVAILLYPGFGQQAIGMVYGHFFLVLTAFLFSIYANLRALAGRRAAWAWTLAALAASFLNLITLEYFFLLELIRPVCIWLVNKGDKRGKERLKSAFWAWLPYLVLFLGVGLWRVFFFTYQTNNYAPSGLATLKAAPLAGLIQLIGRVFGQAALAGFAAWAKPFTFSFLAGLGKANTLIYLAVGLAGAALTALALWKQAHETAGLEGRRRTALEMVALGLFILLIAGGPFLLTGLPVKLVFPNDRFTLPFMAGSALVLAGLAHWILPRFKGLRVGLLALLLGLSCAYLFANSTSYRRDWLTQRAFFWQLTWRVPQLQPGTTLMSNDLPVSYYSDNSLSAPLNWIYAPQNQTEEMDTILLYPSLRVGLPELPSLDPGTPIHIDYLSAQFDGSTDQVVALYYQPPACLRILDGQVEADNLFVPLQIRSVAASLSSTRWIIPDLAQSAAPMAEYYGSEPAHGWCYYYEKADLARQQQDWQQVVTLGDQAFSLNDYPNDPAERMPYIEGYAHLERWGDALEQTRLAADVSPVMRPVLCSLWQRIDTQTGASAQKQAAVQQVDELLACNTQK